MSVDPRPGDFRFFGTPQVFYIAVCRECDMALPFADGIERENWRGAHPHDDVEYAIDIRPQRMTGVPGEWPLLGYLAEEGIQ